MLALSALLGSGACDSTPEALTSDDVEAGAFEISWTVDPACPVLGPMAVVLVREPGPHDPFDWSISDEYSCADGCGTTRDLPLGRYSLAVGITDHSQFSLFALSDVVDAELVRDGTKVPIEVVIPALDGTLEVRWDPGQCAALDGDNVIMEAVAVGSASAVETTIDCDAGAGQLSRVPIGDFTLTTTLRNSRDEAVGAMFSTETTISYGNELVSVGHVTF